MNIFKEIGNFHSAHSVANRLLGTEDARDAANRAEAQAYDTNAFQKMMFDTFQSEAEPIRGMRDEYLGYYKDLAAGAGIPEFQRGPEYQNVYQAGAEIAQGAPTAGAQAALLDRARNIGLNEYNNYFNRIATGADVSGAGLNSTNRLLSANVGAQGELLRGSANQIAGFLNNQANSQRQATSSIVGGLGSLFCDERLKENIDHLYIDDDGLQVSEWNYIGDSRRFVGRMAQDIMKIDPEAVSVHPSGYLMVSEKYAPREVKHG